MPSTFCKSEQVLGGGGWGGKGQIGVQKKSGDRRGKLVEREEKDPFIQKRRGKPKQRRRNVQEKEIRAPRVAPGKRIGMGEREGECSTIGATAEKLEGKKWERKGEMT